MYLKSKISSYLEPGRGGRGAAQPACSSTWPMCTVQAKQSRRERATKHPLQKTQWGKLVPPRAPGQSLKDDTAVHSTLRYGRKDKDGVVVATSVQTTVEAVVVWFGLAQVPPPAPSQVVVERMVYNGIVSDHVADPLVT